MAYLNTSIRSRGYLPHWERECATYFVTFRLADSLPQSLLVGLRQERDALFSGSAGVPPASSLSPSNRLRKLNAILRQAEQCLDSGLGACHLRNPSVAKIIADALVKFSGQRYDLLAWCVMPNHVHALFSPREPYRLESILHSWKSYSAHRANDLSGRSGTFWQREYFDHLVRSEAHLLKFVRYIQENPRKAGLHNWPWVST